MISDVRYKVDITTLEKQRDNPEFSMNDIGCIRIHCSQPLFFDSYAKNRITGSFVLIDEQTNNTVAAGMIIGPAGVGADEDAGFAI